MTVFVRPQNLDDRVVEVFLEGEPEVLPSFINLKQLSLVWMARV